MDNVVEKQNVIEVPEEELLINWTLIPSEIEFIYTACKGENNSIICFALQLCSLKNNGRFIDNYKQVEYKIIQHLSQQFGIKYIDRLENEISESSEYRYRKRIKEFLNYQDYDKKVELELQEFILSKLKEKLYVQNSLLKEAEEFLIKLKVILPTNKSLGRKIAKIKQESLIKIYEKISKLNTEKKLRKYDKLLKSKGRGSFTEFFKFKQSAPEATAKVINEYLDRLSILLKLKVHKLNFEDIDQELIISIAKLVSTYDADSLRKISPSIKRYAYITCFLVECYKHIVDNVIDLNNQLLAKKNRISKNSLDLKIKPLRRQSTKSIDILLDTVQNLLEYTTPKKVTLEEYKDGLDVEEVREAVKECRELNELEKYGYYDELLSRYSNLREYTKRFYKLDFKATKGSEDIIRSIKILQQLNENKITKIPEDAPIEFVFDSWKELLYDEKGNIKQKPWEISLYFAVKKALGNGDVYIEFSKHHRNFWNTIYSKSVWKEERKELYRKLELPKNFKNILRVLKKEYKQYFNQAIKSFNNIDSFAYISKSGELRLRKDDALPISNKVKKLKQLLESRMPIIRIEELLHEVDERINYTKNFKAMVGYEGKEHVEKNLLYASLIAHGTNMGLYGIFNSTKDIDIEPLRTVSRWYMHDDALLKTNRYIVNQHNNHPLSKIYGSGKISSSDGQRYRIRSSSSLAAFYPRYYGYYEKVISVYTHMSDQYSVFNTQVISCSVREATYVLTGLLFHGTQLETEFHTTDTHGFTEIVFALCYLLGLTFCPRIKGIKYQQLYKLDKSINYQGYNKLFSGFADIGNVPKQWDQIVRVVASLKNGIAPAHIIVQKLTNRSSSDNLTKALITMGRIIKTIYIFRYISDSALRYKVYLQLNRGESRHNLAQHVFFANQGIFKTKEYVQIMNKASCLSILSNLILYWNTVKLYQMIEELKSEGYEIDNNDLAKISPLLFKHILVHGTYSFKRWEHAI